MYLPSLFAERDPERLRAFLESYSFGTLIAHGDPPEVAHAPFALTRPARRLTENIRGGA